MDVEPHAADVVAEQVVRVAFAAGPDRAQVRHWQMGRFLAIHFVKVLRGLSDIRFTIKAEILIFN